MKKFLALLFFALLSSQTTFAQLQKGDFQLGGAINFSTWESSNSPGDPNSFQNSSQNFSVNPNLGYFVTDKWVLGMSFRFNNGSREVRYNTPILGNTDFKNESWGTGFFARRYFPIQEKMAFFGEFQSTVDWRTEENSIAFQQGQLTNSNSFRGFNNTLFAGLSFFPAKWVSVEASVNPIGFGMSRNTAENTPGVEEKRNSTFFNLGVNTSAIFLGFNFFLNQK